MLVAGFPSPVFGTNVYVIAPDSGEECIVIDPGMEVAPGLDELLADHRLKPVAVLLTHGHLDHTFSVVPVAGSRGIPAYIHPGDRELLADPMKGLSRETTEFFGGRLEWQEPEDVLPLEDGRAVELAGLKLAVDHAPGHTPGSVMFRLDDTVVSGDVLFAGSIGRTDLPGGSHEQMLESLRRKVLPLPGETTVLPGHGPTTTIAQERATNPFLLSLTATPVELDPQAGSEPRRGL